MLRRLIAALLLLAASPALAGLQVDPFPVATMMAETGLSDVFDGVGDVVAADVRQPDGPKDQPFIASWDATAARMFDVADLNAKLAAKLAASRLSTADQSELRAFYQSPLGRRLTAIDVATSRMTPEQSDALSAEGDKLVPTLTPERSALYDEFWHVAATPTLAISQQLVRAQVIATILSAQHPVSVPWNTVEDALARVMPRAVPKIRDSVKSGNAVLYRELSDAEFIAYLSFLKSPAAQRFYVAVGAALDDVLGDEMTRFGNAVAAAAHGVSA